MINVAMVGCGAIGSSVLRIIADEPAVEIHSVVTSPAHFDEARRAVAQWAPCAEVSDALPAQSPDLLLECAGHGALLQHVLPALSRGIPCIVTSVGALSAPGMCAALEAAAREGNTQVQLISGAIGGIDALAAARFGGLTSVVYTGRKPPKAWKSTPAEEICDLDSLARACCIFSGNAGEAAQRFPQNANVAATLSLAGIGLQKTQVQLFADPDVTENIHHLEAVGSFGSFELTLRGHPLAANPKTSVLTVYSAVRALLNRSRSMAI